MFRYTTVQKYCLIPLSFLLVTEYKVKDLTLISVLTEY